MKRGRHSAGPSVTYFLPPPFGAGGGVDPGRGALLPRPPPEGPPVLLGPFGGVGRLLMISSSLSARIIPPSNLGRGGRAGGSLGEGKLRAVRPTGLSSNDSIVGRVRGMKGAAS